jgi:ABC-type uncharacterized transport system fused permease/ATPase subunit
MYQVKMKKHMLHH